MSYTNQVIKTIKPLLESGDEKSNVLEILKKVLVGDKDQYGNKVVEIVSKSDKEYIVKFNGPDGNFELEFETEKSSPNEVKEEAQEWLATCGGD